MKHLFILVFIICNFSCRYNLDRSIQNTENLIGYWHDITDDTISYTCLRVENNLFLSYDKYMGLNGRYHYSFNQDTLNLIYDFSSDGSVDTLNNYGIVRFKNKNSFTLIMKEDTYLFKRTSRKNFNCRLE